MLKLVDLTLPIEEGMLTFQRPWHVRVQVRQLAELAVQGRETRSITLGSHTGTHVDAPRHFMPGGAGVDQLPLDALIGRARLLDLHGLAPLTPITTELLAAALGGAVPARLVLRFDWDRFWGAEDYYRGHPYLTEEAARWLVQGGLRLLGLDAPMPDNPEPAEGAPDSPIHKILLGSGVILLEYLCNLGALRSPEITLVALPLRVSGADGAPTRCVAYDGLADFTDEAQEERS
ncbi:MAG: cyclase [Deltaproteobacteria bacterium HGW-Deltaproteobacteria-8]|jgi:kynurenine formamidase|nr:MAG: cyclase [Deltaproteobacteria bacterium HGW-Deltaproteobacteria-8]